MTSTQRPAADDKAADAEYITAVRGGDSSAFGPLYKRHRAAAYHLARQLVAAPSEAEDLVSDAFAKVFNTLLAGGGPDSAFRAYLLTTVRNTFYDAVRQGKKLTYTDNLEPHDTGESFEDPAVQGLDNALAAKAFASLPERWQTVLWHTEIEGESPSQVAPLLGLTANGASALAYRAREGLKQAFLQAHVADVADSACKVTSERLGAWSRGGLSKREQTQVDRHLEECDRCAAVAAEIADLGTGLRGVVAVLAIGTPTLTAAYLAGGSMAKIGALAWAGAAAPAAGFAKISALVPATGLGTGATAGAATGAAATGGVAGAGGVAGGGGATGTAVGAATSAAAAGAGSSGSSIGAAASAATHASRGLWGAVAGTAAVATIATVVIVSANFGDPDPISNDAAVAAPTTNAQSTPPQTDQNTPQTPVPIPPPSEEPGIDADLDNLPSIPAINEDLLGELPSIDALPDELVPEEEPVDPDPTEGEPEPEPTPEPTPGPGDNGDEDDGEPGGGDDDGEDPEPEPEPEPEPVELDTTYADGTYTSAISVRNVNTVVYDTLTLTIAPFSTGLPSGVAQCRVTVANANPQIQDCGDDVTAVYTIYEGMEPNQVVPIQITVIMGDNVMLPAATDISMTLAGNYDAGPSTLPLLMKTSDHAADDGSGDPEPDTLPEIVEEQVALADEVSAE